MSLSIETLDVDGALREHADIVENETRSGFLKKGLMASGGLMAGGAFLSGFPAAAFGQTPKGDVAILNFALTLEYLEQDFYAKAQKNLNLTGGAVGFTKAVVRDETAHVKGLKAALGKAAVNKPKFDFSKYLASQKTYLETAYVLENTGVKAYLGQAPNIKTPAILLTAASIVTIEARHAGAIAVIIGKNSPQGIAPTGAFDAGAKAQAIINAVNGLKVTGKIPSARSQGLK